MPITTKLAKLLRTENMYSEMLELNVLGISTSSYITLEAMRLIWKVSLAKDYQKVAIFFIFFLLSLYLCRTFSLVFA